MTPSLQLSVTFLISILSHIYGFQSNGGFIFTAPKRLFAGSDERLCISFRNVSQVVDVQVIVLEQKGSNEIASANEHIDVTNNAGKCFNISIPKTKAKEGRLALSISFPTEDYSVNYYEQILIQTSPDVVYILTDKPVYGAGHTVKFRIFIIRSDLTPVEENIEKIWIENPNGVHLAQWLNESTANGFIDKSFTLSAEPLIGLWSIKVKRKFDDITTYRFRVDNYVLPRFTVSLDTPKITNPSADFNVSVCARYVFGEPVHGSVRLHLNIKCSFSFYCLSNLTTLRQHLNLNKDGCISHGFQLSNLSKFAHKIIVNATVREAGTGLEATTVAAIDVNFPSKRRGLEFSSLTKQKYFKPMLPFRGQIIRKSEETDNEILLCSDMGGTKTCSQIYIENSVLDFVIPPIVIVNERNFSAFVEIKNNKEHNEQYSTKLNLVTWYSPTGSYLQLEESSNGLLKCNRTANFTVMFSSTNNADISQFFYLVKSRGQIVKDGILTPEQSDITGFTVDGLNVIGTGDFSHVRQFQFSLFINSNFSPGSYLLVYYIGKDGEVIADTITLNVAKCLKTSVYTRWNENITLPGDLNTIKINTTPNSVCALSVTDRSTKMLSKSAEFNKETIFKAFRKFDIQSRNENTRRRRCRNSTDIHLTEEDSFLSMPETDSRFVDSQQAFQDFGALVISNLIIETSPCKSELNMEKSMRHGGEQQIAIRTFGNEAENMVQLKKNELIKLLSKQREASVGFELRNFFPETWIWEIINISDTGIAELTVPVPHTITEWDSEAICLSRQTGLGVAEIKRLTTYQPFFLDFTVPNSIKKKEIFYLSISVFNYEDQNLPVKITLSPSNKFTIKKENVYSDCIKSKSKFVQRFVLEPIMLGEAVLTVMAEIDNAYLGQCGNYSRNVRDTVSKKTYIKHEGFPADDVKSGFICADNKNFENEVSWKIKIPADIVESSVSIDGLVSGDILGPSLKNIDQLLTLPTGCGEQNMILLAPNILILEYLLLTKSDEAEIIEKALRNLDVGYQKQLNYRLADGSYNAFGKRDEKGSIWLTSFVVRYISQAQKFIYIDKNDLNSSVSWILKHQLENGCFPVIGNIYHRDLKGKFSENDSSKALTAYIIISLIESGLVTKTTTSMKNAVYCLKGIEHSSGTYAELLTTYALLMVGEVRDAQAIMFELLKNANRAYGLLWWGSNHNASTESSVEMTAYGILCLLKLGGSHFTAAASDAVKWITQYRNRYGGFVSSQDTILALEAISKLSSTLPRMSSSDKLLITLHTKNNNFSYEIREDNILLQQTHRLPSFLSDVKFSAHGMGCALVQTHLRYNTRHGKQSNDLKIQLKIDSVSDIDLFFVTKFNICIRNKSPLETIKMAILEVFMVSGFYPDRTSLYDIPISRKAVRKWEEYEEKIVFYFEDLKQRKVCVQFLVNQEVCVEKTSPAIIKLYDYYNNEHVTTVKYSLQPECNNGTGNRLNNLPDQKFESKRDTSQDDLVEELQSTNDSKITFDNFMDVTHDLETPDEIGPLPLYVPNPLNANLENNCPNCLNTIPTVFPNLLCSAQKVMVVGRQNDSFLHFVLELTEGTTAEKMKPIKPVLANQSCSCLPLEKANSTVMVIITHLKKKPITETQQLILDNSAVIIPLSERDELPDYIKETIQYCKKWYRNGK